VTFEPIEAAVLSDVEATTRWTARCMAEGTPVPNITWWLTNRLNFTLQVDPSIPEVSISSSVSGNVATSSLMIRNVTIEARASTLTCIARNGVTAASKSQMPYLAGKNEAPVLVGHNHGILIHLFLVLKFESLS